MTAERENHQKPVPREAFNEVVDLFLAYRWTIREMLWKAGVPNNPGSLDTELFDGLAKKLGIESPFESMIERAKEFREMEKRKNEKPRG